MSESTFAGDGTEARFDTSIGVADWRRGGGWLPRHPSGGPPPSFHNAETACRARGSRRSLSITPSFLPHVQCFVNFLVLCRIDRSPRLRSLVE